MLARLELNYIHGIDMTDADTNRTILSLLDELPLECDGLSKVASLLLTNENIPHNLNVGSVEIDEVGSIAYHCWISFDDGRILDLRARMWLGKSEEIPHGIFRPQQSHHYHANGYILAKDINPILLPILTGLNLEDFPRQFSELINPDLATNANTNKTVTRKPRDKNRPGY